jgi:hypothetical protein
MHSVSWKSMLKVCVYTLQGFFAIAHGFSANAEVFFEGAEYYPAGKLTGDQVLPSVATGASRGVLVWQDNSDGEGWGIRGRLLGSQLTGLAAPFFVANERLGDQENVKVVLLANGDFLLCWQGGVHGAQQIYSRILSADGVFKRSETQISLGGTNHRNPMATAMPDGSAAIVWTAMGIDGDMESVQLARIDAAGSVSGSMVTVNTTVAFNQRDAHAVGLSDGSLLVTWVSEQQTVVGPTSIVARRYTPDNINHPETILVSDANPLSKPVPVASAQGFVLVWNEYDLNSIDAGWDVKAQRFDSLGSSVGKEILVNRRNRGNQKDISAASIGSGAVLVSYTSSGLDGSGLGIGAQLLAPSLELAGDEIVLNSTTRADQTGVTITSDGNERLLAVWTSYSTSETGMDLQAQRVTGQGQTLLAPQVPYVNAISSSKLRVSWSPLDGLAIKQYHLFIDGKSPALTSSQPYNLVGNLAPRSAHSIQLAYELLDGRISPLSDIASAATWGEDENTDGLPDDWQERYFGPIISLWPGVGFDSDGDGKTNREEFLSGTNPIDSTSVLRTVLSSTSQGAMLSWNTQPGGIYQLQVSTNLMDWVDYQGVRIAAGTSDATLIGDAPESAYFRVNILR